MKKILIALDIDPTAQKVAEAGYELAKAMGAQVVLIHVIADPVYYSSSSYSPIMGFGGFIETDFLQPDIMGKLKDASLDFLEKTKTHLGDETIQTRVGEGDTAEAISAAANAIQADIIVMGTHSRKWLDSIIMGSATEKVLHHTSIPLYIIPTKKDS